MFTLVSGRDGINEGGVKRNLRANTAICCTLLLVSGNQAVANPDLVEDGLAAVPTTEQQSDYGIRNGSALVVPIPFANPALGVGLSLGAGYLFELAPGADTSFLGLGVMRSDNGSDAYGVAGKLAFGSGLTLDFALASADLRYDLFFDRLEFPIAQTGELFNGSVSYDVAPTHSLGLAVRYLNSDIELRNAGNGTPGDLEPDLSLELGSLGVRYEWDVRDDGDYPTDGFLVGVDLNQGFSLSGPARDYTYASANFDAFRTVGDEKVIGGRLSTCAASSDAPFFDQCSIGFTDGFRGFSPTQFYDERLFSAQAEYRQRLGKRFGYVVFGGIGWTGESFGALTDNGDRVAGGAGIRFRVSQKFPVDLSVDLSTNNDSEEFVYIFVGQRF